MQSAFFKLNTHILPYEKAKELMKEYAAKTFAKKGQAIIECNYNAIDAGGDLLVEVAVKPEWANLENETVVVDETRPEFVREIADPINSLKGDALPLSVFKKYEDAHMPAGTAAYEKRGVATDVPKWDSSHCIQCNQCAFVCPHAAIRPFLVTEAEAANAPEGVNYLPAVGFKEHKYTLTISPMDCTGCGVCITVCPGKKDNP